MAALRALEDRDAKGATTRVNPTIIYKIDNKVRDVVGRTDFRISDNPDYRGVGLITAQVQDGKVIFFNGSPESTASRAAATEMSIAEMKEFAPQVLAAVRKHPPRFREVQSTAAVMKFATVDGIETTTLEPLADESGTVVVTPVAPDLTPRQRTGAPRPPEARV